MPVRRRKSPVRRKSRESPTPQLHGWYYTEVLPDPEVHYRKISVGVITPTLLVSGTYGYEQTYSLSVVHGHFDPKTKRFHSEAIGPHYDDGLIPHTVKPEAMKAYVVDRVISLLPMLQRRRPLDPLPPNWTFPFTGRPGEGPGPLKRF